VYAGRGKLSKAKYRKTAQNLLKAVDFCYILPIFGLKLATNGGNAVLLYCDKLAFCVKMGSFYGTMGRFWDGVGTISFL